MDSKTSVFIAIILSGIIVWISRSNNKIARYLWCHFFGLQFLVYSIGTGYYTLTQEVQDVRTGLEQVHCELERSQDQILGIYPQFSGDLGYLKRKVAKIDHREDAEANVLRAEVIRHRAQLNTLVQVTDQINNSVAQISDNLTHLRHTTFNLYLIILRASRRQEEARGRTRNRNETSSSWAPDPWLHPDDPEEVNAIVDEIPEGNPQSAPFNDYSGNEEPAPDSPQGPTFRLEGEQETSSETSTESLPATPQTTGEGDSPRIHWVIGEIVRRDIERAINSDSDSSEESLYPDSDETDSD